MRRKVKILNFNEYITLKYQHIVLAIILASPLLANAATETAASQKLPTLSAGNAVGSQYNLMDIYQQALAHDAELASALSANKAAQEIIEQGKALYRPNINFSASANNSHTDIRFLDSSVPGGGRAEFNTYQAAVQARQPIYRKQNLVQMDQAETQVSQADKQYHLSQQSLILRTTEAYFQVLTAKDQIDLIAAQKEAILSQLDQAKATFEVGTSTITDVNEAQARYDLIVAQEIKAVNDLEIAKRNVQLITGSRPAALAPVQSDIAVLPVNESIDDWLTITHANNLNIQIQQDAVTLAEQEVELANAGHLPTLDAIASYSRNYQDGSPTPFNAGNDFTNATIGLQLEIPIYQGGSISSQARQAVHNKQKAQDDLTVAKRKAELDTQQAYLNLSTSIAQVSALEQALKSSQTQLDSTKLGYEVGVRTSVDVLDAQQQLYAAKRDLLTARYDYLLNIVRLKTVSGLVAEADIVEINQALLSN